MPPPRRYQLPQTFRLDSRPYTSKVAGTNSSLQAETVAVSSDRSPWRSFSETATYFGLEERQLRWWRSLGAPARRVGRRLVFNVFEVEHWLETQEQV